MLGTTGPVGALADALTARDVTRLAGLLAHDVRLAVPPLHYSLAGNTEVVGGFVALLTAFGDLRYEVRSRYLAPGQVTDEVMLVGRQTGIFLGSGPSRRTSAVPARVIVEHDPTLIRSITVWPDLAALRAAAAGTQRVIDLTHLSDAGNAVAALRAAMPPAQSRLIVSTSRDEPAPARPEAGVAAEPVIATGPSREVPRPPLPKAVRRRRAVVGGTAMLVVATALAGWVALGALRSSHQARLAADSLRRTHPSASDPDDTAAGRARPGGTAPDPPGGGPASGAPGAQGGAADATRRAEATKPAEQLTPTATEVVISSDLLFPTNAYTLTPQARHDLAALIAKARTQHRRGRVVVSGFTDSQGTNAYNLKLSQRRAAAVAAVLRSGLTGSGIVVESRGFGESHPVATNHDADGRHRNRRVTVLFPPAAAPTRSGVSPDRGAGSA